MNIIAMIPARMGSERLKLKNLALLDGRPLISYPITAAQESRVFDRVVVNSDGDVFGKVAERYGAEFYYRDPELASSQTKSDDVVYDFMLKYPSDAVAWVNPISPLQTSEEIRKVVNFFVEKDLDSLITVADLQVHCVFRGEPINFSIEGLFAKTQDLEPVQPFVYSVMMWRTESFLREYRKHGYSLLTGKVGYFPVSKQSSIIIKTDEDLMIAESIIKASSGRGGYQVLYDELAAVN